MSNNFITFSTKSDKHTLLTFYGNKKMKSACYVPDIDPMLSVAKVQK